MITGCLVLGPNSLQFVRAFGDDLEQLQKLTPTQVNQVGYGLWCAGFVKDFLAQEPMQRGGARPQLLFLIIQYRLLRHISRASRLSLAEVDKSVAEVKEAQEHGGDRQCFSVIL